MPSPKSKPGSLGGFSRSGQFGQGGASGVRSPTVSSRSGKDEKPKPAATSANPDPTPTPPTGTPATPAPVLPQAPNNPPSTNNPNLPADKVQAERGQRRADRTLIDAIMEPTASRQGQKYRGSVLSAVYRLPSDPAKAANTLQQFNGPRGQKMTLGA